MVTNLLATLSSAGRASTLREAIVQRGILREEEVALAVRLSEINGLTLEEFLLQRGLVTAQALKELKEQLDEATAFNGSAEEELARAVVESEAWAETPSGAAVIEVSPASGGEEPRTMEETDYAVEEPSAPIGLRMEEQQEEELAVASAAAVPMVSVESREEAPLVGKWEGFLRAEAENTAPVETSAVLAVAPAVRTRLQISYEVDPHQVPEDEETPVTFTVHVANVGRALAKGVILSLDDLPSWFEVQQVERDGGSSLSISENQVILGEIASGTTVTVIFHGVARP